MYALPFKELLTLMSDDLKESTKKCLLDKTLEKKRKRLLLLKYRNIFDSQRLFQCLVQE